MGQIILPITLDIQFPGNPLEVSTLERMNPSERVVT
jgi:hypothetical protein